EEVSQHRVQHEAAMRLVAVKVQGHPEEHQLYHRERECSIAPPWETKCAVEVISQHQSISRVRARILLCSAVNELTRMPRPSRSAAVAHATCFGVIGYALHIRGSLAV